MLSLFLVLASALAPPQSSNDVLTLREQIQQSGTAVATEGTFVAIGDPYGPGHGEVNVYPASGDTSGPPLHTLSIGSGVPNQQFGSSVAVLQATQGQNAMIVVGAPTNPGGTGTAYVFDLVRLGPSSYSSTLLFTLVPPPGSANNIGFGHSVAIAQTSNGPLVAVGAPFGTGPMVGGARAYVFDLTTGLRATVPNPASQPSSRFGESVAFDGSQLVVGAPNDMSGTGSAGAAYVFSVVANPAGPPLISGPTALTRSTAPNTQFGIDVAVNNGVALVGAHDLAVMSGPGRAYLFDTVNAPGTQLTELSNPDPPVGYNDYFGTSLALAQDASSHWTALVGSSNYGNYGSVYTYRFTAGTQTSPRLEGKYYGTVGLTDLGRDVALSPGSSFEPPTSSAALIEPYLAIADGQTTAILWPPIVGGPTGCTQQFVNSTGKVAALEAYGSDSLNDNDVVLVATDMPPNEFGYFLTSLQTGTTPQVGNSCGTLCLAGAIGRYTQNVQNTGLGGAFSMRVDLTNLPQPGGAVQAQVGERWYFQGWFRDTGCFNPNKSNLTDGWWIDVQP